MKEPNIQIKIGDALQMLKSLQDECIDMVMTSPPYWALRDYDVAGQLGLESTFQEYINKLCDIFDEVKRVLKKQGTCWVNIGDTLLNKSLCQIPSRFAIEMTNRGWILRNEIIWHKPNAMPSSANDRFTIDFEKVFFFVKSKKYYFNQSLEESKNRTDLEYRNTLRKGKNYNHKEPYKNNFPKKFREDGMRNSRSVWTIPTKSFKGAHFAVFPEELCIKPIQSGCPENGIVLDPFMGSGTTLKVALELNRKAMGFELNPKYVKIAEERTKNIDNTLFKRNPVRSL